MTPEEKDGLNRFERVNASQQEAASEESIPDTPEARRSAIFVRRYPLLRAVPPEKRATMIRKAFVHPLFLVVMLVAALVALPESIDFLMRSLHLYTETEPGQQAWKILVSIFIPSLLLFWLLRHVILPITLKKVLRKEGYLARQGAQITDNKL